MDPTTISVTAAATLAALQPYLPTIATKASEKIGEGLPAAVGKLWSTLHKRMDVKEAAKEALDDLLKNPESEAFQTVFKVQLEKLLGQDPAFFAELNELLGQVKSGTSYQVRDGAVAAGDQAKAVGKGGTLIEGGVKGDYLGPGASKTGE